MMKCSLILALFLSSLCLLAFDDVVSSPTPKSGDVVLEVDGTKLTFADVERKHYGGIFQANNAVYQAERKAIDEYVDDFLLERQAKKEGLTVDQLLEKHVNGTIPKDPSEEALRLYHEAMESKQPFEDLKAAILDHIRQGRITKAKTEYMTTLRSQAHVSIRLAPPRVATALKDTPVRGPKDAKVMIVEYADYECPYCQQAKPAIDKLVAEYGNKVAFAYKDVPLPMHAHAQKAAEAAHCAGLQGKYWEYHDALFTNRKLEIAQLKESAGELKLDTKAFATCLDSGATANIVKDQLAEGAALQLEGTPSFVINGRFFKGGFSYEALKSVVEEEFAAASAEVKPTVASKK
jgi:protein-disulfide isomerase